MNKRILEIIYKNKPQVIIFNESKHSDVDSLIFSYIKSINCDVKKPYCDECDDCKKINCKSYYDLKIFDGNSNNILKSDVMSILNEFKMSALEPKGNKFMVIFGIENLNKYCTNLLLKTIEDIPEKTYYIFTSRNKEKILSTIKSRSQIYNVLHEKEKIIDHFKNLKVDKKHIDALMAIYFNKREMEENYFNEEGYFKIYDLGNKIFKNKNNYPLIKETLNDFKKLDYFEIDRLLNYIYYLNNDIDRLKILEIENLIKTKINKTLIYDKLVFLLI